MTAMARPMPTTMCSDVVMTSKRRLLTSACAQLRVVGEHAEIGQAGELRRREQVPLKEREDDDAHDGDGDKGEEEEERRADEQVGLQAALPAGRQRVRTASPDGRRGRDARARLPAGIEPPSSSLQSPDGCRTHPGAGERSIRPGSQPPAYSSLCANGSRTTLAHSAGVELAVCLGLELCQSRRRARPSRSGSAARYCRCHLQRPKRW